MNRAERKLTWEYFWQQKNEEIREWFEDNRTNLIIFSIVLPFFMQIGWVIYSDYNSLLGLIIGLLGSIILGYWILFGIYCAFEAMIKGTIKWLKSNWKKAKTRALTELNSGKNE